MNLQCFQDGFMLVVEGGRRILSITCMRRCPQERRHARSTATSQAMISKGRSIVIPIVLLVAPVFKLMGTFARALTRSGLWFPTMVNSNYQNITSLQTLWLNCECAIEVQTYVIPKTTSELWLYAMIYLIKSTMSGHNHWYNAGILLKHQS